MDPVVYRFELSRDPEDVLITSYHRGHWMHPNELIISLNLRSTPELRGWSQARYLDPAVIYDDGPFHNVTLHLERSKSTEALIELFAILLGPEPRRLI
jgi:hypothetical protein